VDKRLIPKDPEEGPTIFDVARLNYWDYVAAVPEDRDNLVPGEHVFEPENMHTTVRYVDDFITEVKYALLRGEAPAEIQAVADTIAETVPVYTDEEILALYPQAETTADKIRAVRLTGLVAPPECEARFLRAFRAALSDPEAPVRHVALEMVGYPGWPELADLVRQRVDDPDEDIRHDAEIMLRALRGETG
jgi:hypothetical protein